MKTWQIFSIAAAALAAGAGLSMAVASGPDRPYVAAVVPLDASGNGSGRGVWIVDDKGSAKYCVTAAGKAAAGTLPTPICSPWNISMRYQAPGVN